MIYVLRYLLVVLYTIVWGVPAVVVGLVDRSGEAISWMARRWASWILTTCRIRVEVEGLEHVDPRQPYVFMSNHQSAVDIVALVQTIPNSFRFTAKRELVSIPIFGWALVLGGHIIIDRGDRPKAIKSLAAAARKIRSGTSVLVFPEGTRSPSGVLQGFRKGGFHLAIAAQVPVLPVTVSGSQRITPKHSLRVASGALKIVYGKPISTEGLTPEDRDDLVKQVWAAVEAGYDAAYQGPLA